PLLLLQDMVRNILGNPIYIIGLLPVQEIYGPWVALVNFRHDRFYVIHLEKNHQFCAMLALNFPSYSFRVKIAKIGSTSLTPSAKNSSCSTRRNGSGSTCCGI